MAEDIRNVPDFYRNHGVTDYLEHHWPSGSVSGEIEQRARTGLLRLLHRLDETPRDDPIWRVSNRCPTLAKVADFIRALLDLAPGDLEALWASVGLSLHRVDTDFGWAALARLFREDPFDPYLVVVAAHRAARNSGANSAVYLQRFLVATNLLPQLPRLRKRAKMSPDPSVSK